MQGKHGIRLREKKTKVIEEEKRFFPPLIVSPEKADSLIVAKREYCFSIIVFIISAARCLKKKIRRINQSKRQEQKRGAKIKYYYSICTCESFHK